MNKAITIGVTMALSATQAFADKCYALAFSSGDQSSAYQAGVLQGLTQNQTDGEYAYSAVSGVSGGGVNAAILGSFKVGEESKAADRMVQFWQNTTSSKLYKDWLGGVIQGLTIEAGLYNDKLLSSFLETELSDIGSMQRFVDVGITNVLTGAFVDNTATLDTNLQDIMFASFSYAGFFPPAESMGGVWFDGSVIWDLDIFSAVNKCLETHEQKDIVVDVLLTSEKVLKKVDASQYNSIEMLIRYLIVARYYGAMDGLLRAQFAYPEVDFRHIISPSGNLSSSILPLMLTETEVAADIAMGVSDGKAAAADSNYRQSTADTLQFFGLKKKLDERVKGISFDDFVEMKRQGVFGENYNIKDDARLENLFLK